MMRAATRCLLLVLPLCLLSVGESAGQATTASITGTVVNEAGEPLAGVNVVAVHQPTGTRYGAATSSSGSYSILNMRTGGPYTVRASFVGYQTVEDPGIQLALGEKRTIDFQLRPQTEELDEVQVIARQTPDVISKSRTGAATNISSAQIEELPTIGRSLTDFIRLVPQAQGDGSIAGANSRYNSIQIDGATLDDVFGLGEAVPGSQAGAEPISLDAIKEFNINIAPYDVRSGGFTGGQINAITKSGSNQFEGSLRFKGLPQTGDNLEGVATGEFDQAYYVGTLGGPIIEDELFFFVTGELKRESSPLDVRVGQDVEGTNVFREPQETLEDFRSIFQNTYNYNPGGLSPLTQREDNKKFLAKLDWNINQSHRLTLRNNYVDAEDDQGIDRSPTFFSYANRQYVFQSTQNSFTAQLNSTFGSNIYNEARFVYTSILDERDVRDTAFPETTIELGGGEALGAGIGRFSQANRLEQDLFEFTNDFTYVAGDHSLTFGTSNKFYTFNNLFIQDYFGTYTFESFETPGGDEVSVRQAFQNGQPTQYLYSYATEAAGTDRPVAEFSAFQLGLYAQDEWQALPDLRLTLGVRVDVPVLPDEPTYNPTAEEAFGRSTSNVASGNPMWSPRVGFNFDRDLLLDGQSTQIRGGVGIFSGDPPYVWISNQYSNTGADFNRIDATFSGLQYTQDPEACIDAIENGTAEEASACNYDPDRRFVPQSIGDAPTEEPLPRNAPFCQDNPNSSRCSDLLAPVQTTEINLISEDFKYPQTFRTNLAIDQELPLGFVATLEGLYSTTMNDVVYRNVNLQTPAQGQIGGGTYPIQESKYGRPLYGTPNGAPNRVSERFTNALLLENSNEGYRYSLTTQLQRNVADGLNGSLAYTYSRATSVNNGSSSRAISNWTFNEAKDINDPRTGTADYEIRHRILGTLNYTLNFADRFGTTIGLVYEGRSGEPFSWIYTGNANGDSGDGASENDLVYVPETRSDILLESENWDLMNAFIESSDALDDARGSVIRRNTARTPWQNLLSLHLAQSIDTFEGQDIRFTLDVDNVLNLLNDDWGQIQNTSFNSLEAWSFEGYVVPSDVGTEINGRIITEDDVGKPRVSFEEETVRQKLNGEQFFTEDIFSRWRMRLGVKYTF